jgi:hypothetical protein
MSPKKQRGGPADWTTESQKLWLVSQRPAHTAARTHAKFSQFWASTFEGWFAQWPNDSPTTAELEQGLDAAYKMKAAKKVSELHVFYKSGGLPTFITNRD